MTVDAVGVAAAALSGMGYRIARDSKELEGLSFPPAEPVAVVTPPRPEVSHTFAEAQELAANMVDVWLCRGDRTVKFYFPSGHPERGELRDRVVRAALEFEAGGP